MAFLADETRAVRRIERLEIMTQMKKAMEYARQHSQSVSLCWIDRRVTECESIEAVEFCTRAETAGRIIGVVAEDKALESMLNRLLDDG